MEKQTMVIEYTTALEQQPEVMEQIRHVGGGLNDLLARHSPNTRALWDIQDKDGRRVLTLALSDPWGYASEEFALADLRSSEAMSKRLVSLVAELRNSAWKERIEIRDTFATAEKLDVLRKQLCLLPDISRKGLKLHNQIRLVPERADGFLLTDFAVEVDASVADQVRAVLLDCGFVLREEPLLKRPGMVEAVKKLVEKHHSDDKGKPRYALCFRITDPVDLHLLEIADDVDTLGDGALEGIGFTAGGTLPGARSIVLYLTSPADLDTTMKVHPYHPALRAIRAKEVLFLHPEDEGKAFYAEFPQFAGGA